MALPCSQPCNPGLTCCTQEFDGVEVLLSKKLLILPISGRCSTETLVQTVQHQLDGRQPTAGFCSSAVSKQRRALYLLDHQSLSLPRHCMICIIRMGCPQNGAQQRHMACDSQLLCCHLLIEVCLSFSLSLSWEKKQPQQLGHLGENNSIYNNSGSQNQDICLHSVSVYLFSVRIFFSVQIFCRCNSAFLTL